MFYSKKIIIGASLSALFLTSCGVTPPVNFPQGGWRPMNDFPSDITEIPLTQQKLYQPLRIDVSLKGMLQRWARQANFSLSYRHSSDFTLSRDVARIQQPNIEEAIRELNEMYQHKGVDIRLVDNHILVSNSEYFGNSELKNIKPDTKQSIVSFPQLPDLSDVSGSPAFSNQENHAVIDTNKEVQQSDTSK
jgi:hypothetical protein